jgi:outer membrane PBP1 activator LpoA protein
MKISAQAKLLSALTLALLISACAEQRSVDQSRSKEPAPVATIAGPLQPQNTEYSARLLEAESLLQRRQLLPAASILRELEGSKLNGDEWAQLLLMQTELLYLEGESRKALRNLQKQLARSPEITTERHWLIQQWQLRLLLAQQGPLAAARHAQSLLGHFEDATQQQTLIDFSWHNLHRCDVALLNKELASTRSVEWRAWLQLALLAAQVMESPDVQVAELQLWQQSHPDHPLATALPGGLGSLSLLQQNMPQRIALVLPLSGDLEEAGRAILDGFLASQFQAQEQGWPRQQLIIMDSGSYEDINAAYNAAVDAGAELMIGPLAREELIAWQARESLPIPLMTLNWFPPASNSASVSAQLALAPEDESRQVAQLAFEADARNALLIRPQGEWGDDMSEALFDRWSELEGTIYAVARYSGQQDYSNSLKEALNLAQSQQRANRIQQLMGKTVEFSPRRRRDLDAVFLLASKPEDARSIKPLIAFHYAGDLPVYANSQVYSGRVDPVSDRDLNGVRLVEIPWIMNPESPVAQRIAADGGDPELAALYALGADAFLLNWRIQQLRESPHNLVRGNTGLLSMDSESRLHRELIPARIRRGEPEAI